MGDRKGGLESKTTSDGNSHSSLNPYYRVNKFILDQLDKGVMPWKRPWSQVDGKARNYVSQRVYSGYNRFILEYFSLKHKTSQWLTFKQCNQKGGKINKGVNGIPIVYWNWVEKENKDNDENQKSDKIPFMILYTVFNVDQTNLNYEPAELQGKTFHPIDEAERIVRGYNDSPPVFNNAQKAFYTLYEDAVYIPDPRQFHSQDDYYAVLFHELGHSTGHINRLNRGLENCKYYGDENYSQEELVAELTSCYLCSEAGLDSAGKLEQSASYIEGWSKTLKQHPRWFVYASNHAQKAADYILGVKNESPNDNPN